MFILLCFIANLVNFRDINSETSWGRGPLFPIQVVHPYPTVENPILSNSKSNGNLSLF